MIAVLVFTVNRCGGYTEWLDLLFDMRFKTFIHMMLGEPGVDVVAVTCPREFIRSNPLLLL
jgi:hypothetical protein